MKKLIVALLLLAGLGYGGSQAYDWVNYQVQTPISSRSQPVSFTVAPDESSDAVGADLARKNLVRDPEVFRYYLRYTGAGGNIQAGSFVLDRNMTMSQIVDALQHAKVDQIRVTIPEGYTVQLEAQEAQKAGIGTAADYLAQTKATTWTYDFLTSRPAGRDLEGFLLPQTYSLNRGATAKDLVKAQLDEFGRAFSPDLRTQAAQPTAVRPAESVFNIVILASMVEREVNRPEDRAKVCGLYYNRLKIGMALQVDATILYAEGVWKKSVLFDDLKFASPYNTYLNPGLPPGPIANPGIASIKACVSPDNNNYLYYFTDTKEQTHFDSSFDQFRQDQAKYGVYGQ